MPFFVNPTAATKSGCDKRDIELMLHLIPYIYSHTASFVRPDVRIRHAWYIEHKSPLGSCADSAILDALTPVRKGDPEQPSRSWSDYDVPTELPAELARRVSPLVDLAETFAEATVA